MRTLKRGAVRMLGKRHDGPRGVIFRKAYDALADEFSIDASSPMLLRLEASRAAAAWVNLVEATRELEAARVARERQPRGGSRPGRVVLERLARRQGLADQSYRDALDHLREIADAHRARRRPAGLDDLGAALRAQTGDPPAGS